MEPREVQAAQSSPARQDNLSPAQLGTSALRGLQARRVPPAFSGLIVRRCLLRLNCHSLAAVAARFLEFCPLCRGRTAANRPPKNKPFSDSWPECSSPGQ